jgi:ABC-2 type transport system ATP-binding protein
MPASPPTPSILSIAGLTKTYGSGLTALSQVDLEIREGEIFALLGPQRRGQDHAHQHRLRHRHATSGRCWWTATTSTATIAARAKIGLVPQELSTDAFETVWATVRFSRGLFGRPKMRRTSRRCCAICRCGTSATIAS